MTPFPSIWRGLVWASSLVAAPLLGRAQALVSTAVTPAANAAAAGRTDPLRLRFSQPLTPAAPAALHVFSSQRGGRRTHATPASGREHTLTFTPSAYPFQPGETIRYTVTTAAASASEHLARPLVGQFTTAVSCTSAGVFEAGTQVAVGRYPDGLALGDVDGDGDLDVLNTQFSAISNTVSVRLNDGTGQCSGTQSVAVGNAPKRVVLGDVDGDGDLDLLTANQGSSSVSVRFNDGRGQFSGGSDLGVDYYPTRVTLGDLDGDGDLDLLVATGSGWLNVRLNDGAGGFRPGPSVRASGSTTDATLGDVDGDGDLDVVASNFVSNAVSVRLNDGAGSFSGTLEVPTGAEPQALALGDVDGDGDLDLVVTSGSTSKAYIQLNTGRGSFTAGAVVPVGVGPYTLALGDVDGDGDLDLLTGNIYGYVSLGRNQGGGNFLNPDGRSYFVTDFVNTTDLALGDMDGDGDLDLVTSGFAVGIRLNGGTAAGPVGTVQLTGPAELCPGTSGELTATSSLPVQTYSWSTGETGARLAIHQPGRYAVTATLAGCQTARAEYVVSEGDCASSPTAMLVPNILTPNGDQLNDVFTLPGTAAGSWTLVLYNRWGREVYRSAAYQNDWGPAAAAGVYYYYLRQPTSGATQRGWVEVVR
ncbi:hypothetical protein HHL22_22140 [Hymenobacter sp. RP-2-7]|uniref:SbsA Ig-like domain-containing protein n=1 Tax=Hymenobacter polaris TaxID=2682546 RepID=A0A7Y0AIW7_9BACT|nr:FG-GAP-like repeat-containing protein [Hymenobacter polaris]NML67910.1 hypothetical protein [Hymenobacter polaris]